VAHRLGSVVASAAILIALVCGGTACSQPDPNPAPRITGNPAAANPPKLTTTTTSTSTTSTTLFWDR
jgi:hypothetical protein